MTMYWTQKVVVSGNMILVRDEPFQTQYAFLGNDPHGLKKADAKPIEQKEFWGGLLRFHHGPETKEDTAAGSDYGAGQVIVSGNLLVNELKDQVRSIRIEGGRDLLITGNKIVNGWVDKTADEGSLTVVNNEFSSTMAVPHNLVKVRGGVQAIVKNNVMRFAGGQSATAPAAGRQVTSSGVVDEAEAARAEELQKTALPRHPECRRLEEPHVDDR